jgi:hypothetical protein
VSIDLWPSIGRQTDLQLPLIDYPFPLLLPDFFMRWVRLRLGRPCPDNGSLSLMVRGCSPGFELAGKVVNLLRQVGQDRPTALPSFTWWCRGRQAGDAGPGWGREKGANFVRGTLVHHYRGVLAWCAKIFCPIASGYRGIDLPEI